MKYLSIPWLKHEVSYEHEPKVVPLFRNRADAKLQASCSAQALESDRLASKTDAELDAEYMRLVTEDAWSQFQLATRAMCVAQEAMNEAHNRWLTLALKGKCCG